jgi:hypothetical protein
VGELLAWLLVGDDCDGEGCCVANFLAVAYSLKDFCFLLVAFPARYEKLSRYDLFLLLWNIVSMAMMAIAVC